EASLPGQHRVHPVQALGDGRPARVLPVIGDVGHRQGARLEPVVDVLGEHRSGGKRLPGVVGGEGGVAAGHPAGLAGRPGPAPRLPRAAGLPAAGAATRTASLAAALAARPRLGLLLGVGLLLLLRLLALVLLFAFGLLVLLLLLLVAGCLPRRLL